MHGEFPRLRRTVALWCGAGAVLAGPFGPGVQIAHALTGELREATTATAVCVAPESIAHAAAGLDFGGKELSTASAARTATVRAPRRAGYRRPGGCGSRRRGRRTGQRRVSGSDQPALVDKIRKQADALPPDARAIHPGIR
ncbi:hypothetical protein [Streptomyces diastatochromogenes]|uniref:hypothetical protein n=1 Tax=Streptomyces diastatochromogenes TaxID=42236 RepID=UPI0036A9F2F1